MLNYSWMELHTSLELGRPPLQDVGPIDFRGAKFADMMMID